MVVTKKQEIAPVKVEQKETKNTTESKPLSEVMQNSKPVTAHDRIKKAEQFDILTKRFQALQDKKTELDKFLISDSGLQGVSLYLEGGNKSFEISNTSVIKEVLGFAKTKLNVLLEETESEVLNFSI